jgi:hypothetical protein
MPTLRPPVRARVAFVHGLWLTGIESFVLRRHLAARGYSLSVFPYSSLAEPLPQVLDRCARFGDGLAAQAPRTPVHFVGHSLGGVVLYRLFERGYRGTEGTRVVMLGAPLHGCAAGRRFASLAGGRARDLLGRIAQEELLADRERRWDSPVPLGLVAGTRPLGLARLVASLPGENDGVVTVDETRLPGATASVKLPVAHSEMLFSARCAHAVADFLDRGDFGGSR